MDQNRLYYQTPYVKSFMCTVKRCEPDGTGAWLAELNQTGFYPEGGGQPSDTGTLNGVQVLSVQEQGDQVIHRLADFIEPGTLAEGVIDWQRRYDNMQQHTGEHILSGLVHRHFGYDNVGFHMGAEEITVDFNGLLTQEQLDQLEEEANQAVYDNLPVKTMYPAAEELPGLDYRSKKELAGTVRLIGIEGVDLCACCGTHVERTGEVGLIKIRTMIHYKGGVRISMLCGRRALLDYRQRLKDELAVSNLLSAKLALVPEAVEKLKQESQEREYALSRRTRQLLELKAAAYPESEAPLAVFEEDLAPVQLRQFATLLYEQKKGGTVAVFSGSDETGLYQYAVGSASADMRALSRSLNEALSGRGGGSSLMAQGTLRGTRKELERVFAQLTTQS